MEKRKKIEIIITGALVLVFIMLLSFSLTGNRPRQEDVPAAVEHEKISFPLPAGRDLPKDIPWGRDPFVLGKYAAVKEKKQHFSLGAVVWDAETPYALINNEVVKPGQMCEGCRVVEINKDKVVLEKDGRTFTLKMYEQ